ncbi:hypothetical protein WMY93_024229 [Mugilogobius chulae]|uniref:Uncharacterized protein n=1 Tax=Mugilogobius chulae TaxID=88201 RepID=A0AAW0N3G9_9GOBI
MRRRTAFLLVDPQNPQHEDSALVENLNRFVEVHRNCFVLLYAPFNGPKEMETLSLIQSRFFGSNLRILPVRTNAQIVKAMVTIAKLTSKPQVDHIRDWLAHVGATSSRPALCGRCSETCFNLQTYCFCSYIRM